MVLCNYHLLAITVNILGSNNNCHRQNSRICVSSDLDIQQTSHYSVHRKGKEREDTMTFL